MLFSRKKRRISHLLIVEDEPLVAFDNEHALSDAGYTVVATVDTVAGGLAHLRSEQTIELVLADVALSDGSGVDVAQEANRLGIPVLFVTGNFPGEAMSLAHGCLSKPYAQRDLIAAIEAIAAVLDGEEPRKLPPGLNLFRTAA